MVYFSCNACGQSVKKNQVEKHYQFQCRNCEVLSCVDCGKDFRGDEYKLHVKCISEDQKYGSKDDKAKIVVNKGEVKQDLWIKNIQDKITSSDVRPVLANLLRKLTQHGNIPRKKDRYENFVKNSFKIYNLDLIRESWDIVNVKQDNKQSAAATATEVNGKEGLQTYDDGHRTTLAKDVEPQTTQKEPEENLEPSLTKKKKKKHKKRSDDHENAKEGLQTHDDGHGTMLSKDVEPETMQKEPEGNLEPSLTKKKKHKKRGDDHENAASETNNVIVEEEEEKNEVKKKKHKKKRKDDKETVLELLQVEEETEIATEREVRENMDDAEAAPSKKKKKHRERKLSETECIQQDLTEDVENPKKDKKKRRNYDEGSEEGCNVGDKVNGTGDPSPKKKKKRKSKDIC